MTSKFSIDNRELLQRISSGEAVVGIDFGNLIVRELAAFRLAAMDSESECLPLDYLQGHKDGLEWAAQLAEANYPETGDWLYDDPIELAKAIRKGPDMPPSQPALDTKPVAYTDERNLGYIDRGRETAYLWGKQNSEASDVALYRHPQPAPVVNEDLYKLANHIASSKNELPNEWQGWAEELEADIRRAAMLQELQKSAGVSNNCRSNENVQDLQAGNSPVIPDGYVIVPKEPTPEILAVITEAIKSMRGSAATYARVLAAAPQPQNAPQNIPEIIPGWIPVSERMPDDNSDVLCTAEFDGPGDWRRKVGYWYEGEWVVYGASWTPTHWMPLPAAPQEVNHG